MSFSTMCMRQIVYLLLLGWSYGDVDYSPELLFRNAVKRWRSRRDWNAWIQFNDELLSRFADGDGSANVNVARRLEIVGAIEEGILAIEKATMATGEGVNAKRDSTLSQMYAVYGEMLSQLTKEECHNLALDPHTLLIGAETVSHGDESSTFLCVENAENALRNAVTLYARNTKAEQLLGEITGSGDEGGNSVHKRKPKEFVAELFDSFADTFDEKLNSLEYKVPSIVGESVRKLNRKYRAVLDAGCGTGLAGRFVRPFVTDGGLMIGVDASQKMLDIAAKCTMDSGCGLEAISSNENSLPLYESLLQMDLEDITVENSLDKVSGNSNDNNEHDSISGFDLVIAADVLVYFGSLDNILQSFAKVSINNGNTTGATLIFSCEKASNDEAPLGWRLLSSGRFAHTKDHVLDAASKAGYSLMFYKEIVPRMERGEEVKGHLFTFVLEEDEKGSSNSRADDEL